MVVVKSKQKSKRKSLKKSFNLESSINFNVQKGNLKEEEKMFIYTLLERSRLERSIASLAFNKGVFMYFIFLLLAILGLTFNYISMNFFYILIFMGLAVLVLGAFPYVLTMITERKRLNIILFNLMLKDPHLAEYDETKYVMKRESFNKM